MILTIPNTDFSLVMNDEMIGLIAYVFLYLTYYFGCNSVLISKLLTRRIASDDIMEKSVYLRRFLGFILLGVIPFLIALIFFDEPITAYGIGVPSGKYAFLWFLIPTVVIGAGSILQSSKTIDTNYYPEVRKKNWTSRRTFINAGYWIIYLLGYEFGIRGMVFFTCLYAFGLWPAIIINSVIYSLIHIFKGAKEAYGAFFLGILFCLITYYTNSIWFALVNHIILAVVNDIKAVKASPEMTFDFGKKSSTS